MNGHAEDPSQVTAHAPDQGGRVAVVDRVPIP